MSRCAHLLVLSLMVTLRCHSSQARRCLAWQKRCPNGQCVHEDDNCLNNECPLEAPYRCGGLCYTDFLKCNVIIDCENGEDEEGCGGEDEASSSRSAWCSVLGVGGIVALIMLDNYLKRAKAKANPTSAEPQTVAPAALAGAPCSSITVSIHNQADTNFTVGEPTADPGEDPGGSARPYQCTSSRRSTTDESVPLTAAPEGVVLDTGLPSYDEAVSSHYSVQSGIAIEYPPPPYEAVAGRTALMT